MRNTPGKPTYIDQIFTSLKTVFTGFLFATLLAVPHRHPLRHEPHVQRRVQSVDPGLQAGLAAGLAADRDDGRQRAVRDGEIPVFEKSFMISAITVTLCSLWPTVINTARRRGVDRQGPAERRPGAAAGLDDAADASWCCPRRCRSSSPACACRSGVGWMVLIAAEMLAQNPGLGKFVWDEFQNGSAESLSRIMVAVFTIGFIGFLLDRVMLTLQTPHRFTYGR